MGSGGADYQYAYGGEHEDLIIGGADKDTLCGKDSEFDEPTDDSGDRDSIVTGGGLDKVRAGPGDDHVWVNAASEKVDVMGGGRADNIYFYGNNADVASDYDFPPGANEESDSIYVFGTATGKYLMALGGGNDVVYNGGSMVDEVEGNEGDDTVNGGNGADILRGLDGQDKIWGNTNATGIGLSKNPKDTIHGGLDNDQIWGGLGQDTLNGEEGNDRIAGDDGDNANGGAVDTVDGGESDDCIWGEAGADTLKGGDNDDKIHGGAGGDNLQGEKGDDTLIDTTDMAVDTLNGGEGNDTMDAFNGNGNPDEQNTIRDIVIGDFIHPTNGRIYSPDIFYVDDRDTTDFDAPTDVDQFGQPAFYVFSSGINPLNW